MTSIIKPSWLRMSEYRLHAYLTYREYPPEIVNQTVKKVREMKAARKADHIKRTVRDNLWRDLLTPARDELGVVRTMKAQAKRQLEAEFGNAHTQAKLDALTCYDAVIAKTIEFLRKVQRACEHTPLQFAAELRGSGQLAATVRGDHWTDYIKPKDRQQVMDAFSKVPDPARGKKKTPFERRISTLEHDRLKEVMWERIRKEQELTQQEQDMTADPFEVEQLSKKLDALQEAAYRLDSLPKTAPIPLSWQALVGRKPE